ncbi:MAG: sodium:solute symporter family protein [Acidobacteriota bacterium]
MASWLIASGVCIGYLLISLILGWRAGRGVSNSVDGYVAADRTMGPLMLYFVIGASAFSSFAFLGAPGWAYSRGAAAFYILAYGAIGMVPLYVLGPRARRVGARFGLVTQAGLLGHRFGSRALTVLLALLSVVVFVPYLTLQMKGAGLLLDTLTEGRIPYAWGAGLTYAVVVAYVLRSGMMAVGWTNTLQGAFMMAVAWGLGLYVPHALHGGIGPMFEKIAASPQGAMLTAPGLDAQGAPWSWTAYSSAVIVSAIGFTMWPHLFMKAFAARSDRALRRTVLLYPTFQLFLVPILLIGFAGVLAFPDVSPADRILPHILTQLSLPPLLVGLVCAGALAASMSSGDAILHAAASIGIRDGVARVVPRPPSDHVEQLWIRGLVLTIALIAYGFALASEISIVALLLGAYGGVAQIFPLTVAAFFWRRATGAGALAGLVAGIGVNTVMLVWPALRPWPDLHEGIYGLVANVVVLVGVSLITRQAPDVTPGRLRIYAGA